MSLAGPLTNLALGAALTAAVNTGQLPDGLRIGLSYLALVRSRSELTGHDYRRAPAVDIARLAPSRPASTIGSSYSEASRIFFLLSGQETLDFPQIRWLRVS